MIRVEKVDNGWEIQVRDDDLRKEFGLGEYAETNKEAKTDTKKAPAKKADTKKK